jgi:hypothetical protein
LDGILHGFKAKPITIKRARLSKKSPCPASGHRARIRATRWLAMTASRHADKSRGAIRPSFAEIFLNPPIRGRRECRAPMRRGKKCARSSHGHTGITRHSPHNGFTVFFVLLGDRALLPPSSAGPTAGLTPASRCQDHTTSPSASCNRRQRAACVHRIPLRRPVTFAKRPSGWGGTR